MSRPPAGRARAMSVAWWARAMAATMARPRPCPLAWLVRPLASRWNGWNSRSTWPGGMTGPVFRDRDGGPPGRLGGADLHLAAGHVVPDRVVHQVADQAFGQARVAHRGGRVQRGGQLNVVPLRVSGPGLDGRPGQGRQIERFRLPDAALAAGQGEQRVDQLLLLLAQGQRLGAGRAQFGRRGVRIGQRHLQQGPLRGERGAQLVRGVGDEVPLRVERRLQPGEQVVERLPQFGELVVAAAQAEPPAQVAGRDVPGGGGDGAQRAEQPARQQPAEHDRQHRHDQQAEQ